LGWPLGRRRNRRVRLTGGALLPTAGLQRVAAGVKRRARLGLLLALALAVAGAAVGAHYYLTRSQHFALRAIRFSPTRHVSAEALQARAGVALGTNLFRVDLGELAREIAQEPWIDTAHARRELPSTLVVDVVEREPACLVALGEPLYLADARGSVFKRANPDETAGLPVVTGIERDRYLAEPVEARAQVRDALALAAAFAERAGRPAVGEIHVDRVQGATLYFAAGGTGVRIGHVDDTLAQRLRRFDAVWGALAASGEKPRLIYLDNRARPDRVTVKLAGAAVTQGS
jgi:cell division protein FtsQ